MDHSEIGKKIEYKLKFLINSMTLRHIETKDILDRTRISKFNNVYSNTTKMQLICSGVSDQTVFPLNTLPIDTKETKHKVYLCEVAVGKPYYVTKEFVEQDLLIPSGYDSLLTENTSEDRFLDGEINITNFAYIMKDVSKILPLYEIAFEYDQEFENVARNKSICLKCKKEEAIVYCPSERAAFCGPCDKSIHFDDLLKRHERKYFEETKQKKYITCQTHPTKVIEFFCRDCNMPICSYCKIDGSHSTVESARHTILTFTDAGQEIKDSINSHTQEILEQKETVENEISKITDNVNTFLENTESLEAEIKKEYKRVLLFLEHLKNEKKQSMNAQFVELAKIRDLLKRVSVFPEELDITDKIQYYKAIQFQRNIQYYQFVPVIPVENYTVEGKLSIVSSNTPEARNISELITEEVLQKRLESQNKQ